MLFSHSPLASSYRILYHLSALSPSNGRKRPGIEVLSRHPNPYPLLPPTYIIGWEEVVPPWVSGHFGRWAGMSSAFWLPPPHDSAPNALLAHEVGSHGFPGKAIKGWVGAHGASFLPARPNRSSRTGVTVFPNEVFDLPQRGVSLPPTKQAALSVRAAILPCEGQRSPLYGGLTCPVQGFDFPCTSKSLKPLQYYEHSQPKPARAPTPSPSTRPGMCPCPR